jgi:hypothetical protein
MVFLSRLLILLLFSSCINQFFYNKEAAKLSFFSSANKKAFSFVIDGKFIEKNNKSRPSALYPKMNVAELQLLMNFLRDNNYCINENGELSFKINSKQEKIYDVTFSSLIEQNYNAKPVSPTTYFGECL